jgi:hypothetical protein
VREREREIGGGRERGEGERELARTVAGAIFVIVIESFFQNGLVKQTAWSFT